MYQRVMGLCGLCVLGLLISNSRVEAATGADNAGDSEYVTNGWNDAQNAGSGFGPWTLVAETTDGFAGFYAADDSSPRGIDNIGAEQAPPLPYTTPETEGFVWATFANKGGLIDRTTAFRSLDDPLDGSGDRFSASFEHGFVNGQAGVALRTGNVTAAATDFSTAARTQFYFTGGSAGYTIEDDAGVVELDGLTAGLPLVPFTFFGVDIEYTLTGPDTYDIKITKYNSEAGSGGTAPDVFDKSTHAGLGGRTLLGTGNIESVALFQSDTETQSDAFFNNLAYSGSGNGGGSGSDNATNPAYSFGWAFGDNGGNGFGQWEMATDTVSGFAGTNIQSGSGSGVDNIGNPAPDGSVWASYANKGDFADKSIQYRDFNNPISSSGDTFSISFENGFVDPGGKVGLALRDRAVNSFSESADDFDSEALFQFFFEGGDGNYTLVDSSGEIDTGVAFSFFGIDLDLTLTGATTFDLDITRYDVPNDPAPVVTTLTGLTFASTPGDGSIESLALFNIDAPTQSDVYFNSLSYENGAGLAPEDLNSDGFVDGLDLGILLGNWNQNGIPPSGGELNGIDPVDGLDLGILLGAWNPAPPSLATATTVPEPTSIVLLLSALIACSYHRSTARES